MGLFDDLTPREPDRTRPPPRPPERKDGLFADLAPAAPRSPAPESGASLFDDLVAPGQHGASGSWEPGGSAGASGSWEPERSLGEALLTDPAKKFTGTLLSMGGSLADMLAPDPVPLEMNLEDRIGRRVIGTAAGAVRGIEDLAGYLRGEPVDTALGDWAESYEARRAAMRGLDAELRETAGRPTLREERARNPINRLADELTGFGRYLGTEAVSETQQAYDRRLSEAAGEGFVPALRHAAANPLETLSSIGPDTAAYLVPAAGFGRVTGATARAGGLSREAAERLAGTAGITATGGTATVQNAADVATGILEADPAQLAQRSPLYRQLIGQGLSPDQAKVEMADRAYSRTLSLSGLSNAVTLGIAARFRANVLEDWLAGRAPSVGRSAITGALGGAAKETASEAAQEGGEAAAAGVGEVGGGVRAPEKMLADVPGAAGLGAIAGGGPGGVVGAAFGARQGGAVDTPTGPEAAADAEPATPPSGVDTAGGQGAARIPRAETLPEQERQIESRFADSIASDVDTALQRYAELDEADGGKVLNTDLARELSEDYSASKEARSRLSAAVHEPASWLIKEAYRRKLAQAPGPGERAMVMFTAGGTGAGKSSAIRALPAMQQIKDLAQIVYDTNLNNLGSAKRKIEQALAAGKKVNIVYTLRDPVVALTQGALPRAMRMGRTVPLAEHVRTHEGSARVVRQLARQYKDNPNVRIHVLDNRGGKGEQQLVSLDALGEIRYNHLGARLRRALDQEFKHGRISEAVYRGTLGDAGGSSPDVDRDSGPPRPGAPGGPVSGAAGARQAAREETDSDGAGGAESGVQPAEDRDRSLPGSRVQRDVPGLRNAERPGDGRAPGAQHPRQAVDEPSPRRGERTAADIQRDARELAESLTRQATPVSLEESVESLPTEIQETVQDTGSDGIVQGVLDTSEGTVQVLSDSLDTKAEAERLLFHGVLAARNFRELLGDAVMPTLKRIIRQYGDTGLRPIARREQLDLSRPADRLTAAEHKLAEIAARGSDSKTLQPFVQALQAWMQQLGFGFELSYAEALETVTKARREITYGRDVQPRPEAAGGTGGRRVRLLRSGPPHTFPDGFATSADSVLDVARHKLQDKYHFLKRSQEDIEASGQAIDDAANAYMAEELYHGKAEAAIEEARESVMKPLLDAIDDAGMTLEEADTYATARHARERNARIRAINPKKFKEGSGSGMPDDEATAILEQYRGNAKVARVGRLIDEITRQHRALLVEAGLEKAETVRGWEEMYQHYVPLKGRDDKPLRILRGKGFDTRGRGKRAYGRHSRAKNIIANLIAQYEADLVRAQKAEVGRSLLRLVEANPNPDLWDVDKVEYKPRIDPRTGLVVYGPDPQYQVADNVLVVKVDGVDHHITFHGERGHRIASAMKNLGAANVGTLTRSLAAVNRYLAAVNTGLNPEFVISNLARDLQTAGINLAGTEADKVKGRIIKDVGRAWRGIRQAQKKNLDGEWAQHFEAFRKAGGKTGWIDAHNDVERLHKQLGKELRNYQRSKADPRRIFRSVLDFIEAENTAIENAVRLSAFVHARKIGLSEAKAASLAKNLTVNFNRKGDYGVLMNALYLFYNASVQGNIRMLQALATSRKVRRIVTGIVVASALLDIANRALGGEDDDGVPLYDKIKPWIKERNLIIMDPFGFSEKGYYKIPLPWGYNIFHVTGQEIGSGISAGMGLKQDYDPLDSTFRVVSSVLNAFNPLGSDSTLGQFIAPTITDPVVQVGENLDWAGRKVAPEQNPFADAPAPDSQMYWNSTTVLSRAVAEKLNELTGGNAVRPGWIDVSPAVLDYLSEFVTGGAGRFVQNTVDTPVKLISGDEVEMYRVPFLRKVYGEVGTRATRDSFYHHVEQVAYANEELELAKKRRNETMRQAVVEEHGAYLRVRGYLKRTERQLRDLREQHDEVRVSPRWTEEQRRARLKKIEKQMEQHMLRFNARVREELQKEKD